VIAPRTLLVGSAEGRENNVPAKFRRGSSNSDKISGSQFRYRTPVPGAQIVFSGKT